MNFVYASTQATPRLRTESCSSEPTQTHPRSLRQSHPPPAHSSPPRASDHQKYDPARRHSSRKPDLHHDDAIIAADLPLVHGPVTFLHQIQDTGSHETIGGQILKQPRNETPGATRGHQIEAESLRKHRTQSASQYDETRPRAGPHRSEPSLAQNIEEGEFNKEEQKLVQAERNTPQDERPNMVATPSAAQSTQQTDACASCHLLRRTMNGLHDHWISCNGCKLWYHDNCAGFGNERKIGDVDKYYCKECEPRHGATTRELSFTPVEP